MIHDLIYSLMLLSVIGVVVTAAIQEKRARIGPVPVLPWVRRRALTLLTAHADPRRVRAIADLGCGWGGMLGVLARMFPAARVTGYEISFWPRIVSRLRMLARPGRIAVSGADFFTQDLSGYDIVFCYLSPYHMQALKPKLETLKPGSLVLSCSFAIPGWTPIAEARVNSLSVGVPVFLYRREDKTASIHSKGEAHSA